jgi:hypothetical protein
VPHTSSIQNHSGSMELSENSWRNSLVTLKNTGTKEPRFRVGLGAGSNDADLLPGLSGTSTRG